MKFKLGHAHRNVYDAIMRRPSSHNINWRDVRAMLSVIADVTEEANGSLKVRLNGKSLLLHPAHHKEIGTDDQLGHLRDFLRLADREAEAAAPTGTHLLVVVDHRRARIFKVDLRGSTPLRITPHQPGEASRHLHYVQDDSNGQRRPELRSYYDDIIACLRDASGILLFGSGTGASSAMEHLLTELRTHHPAVAAKLVGVVVIDENHTTDEQLLARARDFYATLGVA